MYVIKDNIVTPKINSLFGISLKITSDWKENKK